MGFLLMMACWREESRSQDCCSPQNRRRIFRGCTCVRCCCVVGLYTAAAARFWKIKNKNNKIEINSYDLAHHHHHHHHQIHPCFLVSLRRENGIHMVG